MRLVFAGTPAVAVPSLQAILESHHEVVGVVTRPDARRGRGRTIAASPVRELAEQIDVPVLAPSHPSDPSFLDQLEALEPDACPVVAYGAILPPAALAVPRHGWLNLHFSLLPRWRGAAPVQRAILAGDVTTGTSVFRIDTGLDTGPVCAAQETSIDPRETAGALLERLAISGAQLLVSALDAIEHGTVQWRPQGDAGATHAAKLEPDDARINWRDSAVHIDRLVRAVTPYPGAWTIAAGERIKLGPMLPVPDSHLAPGALEVRKHEVRVGTGEGGVLLSTVQPAGRASMDAGAWARGLRTTSVRFE